MEPILPDVIKLDIEVQPSVFDSMGSVTKVAKILETTEYTDWHKLEKYLIKSLPAYLDSDSKSKVTLGLSVYGMDIPPKQIGATALSLKKSIKQSGRSVRIVPNSEPSLNTAQVIHNKLVETGFELMIIKSGSQVILAQTRWVQDIESYRRRDQQRPARDSRVGMLPPKLAQIIINLAIDSRDATNKHFALLDPFCGTGVLLQEARLMDIDVYGTDLDDRMIKYSDTNMQWLSQGSQEPQGDYRLDVADATKEEWRHSFDAIACETYLGRPLNNLPDNETLYKIVQDCNTIHKKFLQNVARQTKPGFRMCIAVPAWHTKSGFKHLPTLDHLEELGYTRMSFVHARSEDLIYHRPGQVVARELVVLRRK
jgi:tRNA (guanine10-N2)-dimethyltransferase